MFQLAAHKGGICKAYRLFRFVQHTAVPQGVSVIRKAQGIIFVIGGAQHIKVLPLQPRRNHIPAACAVRTRYPAAPGIVLHRFHGRQKGTFLCKQVQRILPHGSGSKLRQQRFPLDGQCRFIIAGGKRVVGRHAVVRGKQG